MRVLFFIVILLVLCLTSALIGLAVITNPNPVIAEHPCAWLGIFAVNLISALWLREVIS